MGRQQTRGLPAVENAQTTQDDTDPMVDRVGGDVQFAGDFLGAQTAQNQAQDFAIPRREQGDGLRVTVFAFPHGCN